MTIRRVAFGLLVAGVMVAAFSLVWLFAVSPEYRKLRADYNRSETLQGTFKDWDASRGGLVEYPVTLHWEWRALSATPNRLELEEEFTSEGGGETARYMFPDGVHTLLVDRKTGKYLPDTYPPREGFFSPAPGLRPGDSVFLWVQQIVWPPEMGYMGESEVDGLRVYEFGADLPDLPLARETEGVIQHATTDRFTVLVEPTTGYVVSRTHYVEMKVMDGSRPVVTHSITDLQTPPEEVARLARLAKRERFRVVVLGTFMPWAVMGLGGLLALEGAALLLVASWRGRADRTRTDIAARR